MRLNKTLISISILTLAMSGIACGNPIDAMNQELVDTMTADMEKNDVLYYDSADGWHVTYNANSLLLHTVNEHETWFIYSMSDIGNNAVIIKYVEGVLPQDAIADATSSWSEGEVVQSEDIFVGTEDKWGIWRENSYIYQDENIDKYITAAQYNGGTLLIEVDTRYYGEADEYVEGLLNNVVESIRYDDFGEQTMYEGMTGYYTYTIEGDDGVKDIEYELTLYDNHTGTLSMEDNMVIVWGSKLYIGEQVCEYSFEDNILTFTYNDRKYEFTKEE